MMPVLTTALVVAAFIGPAAWLRRKSALPAGWHPVMILSTWALVTLALGLVGALAASVVVVVGGGVALLVVEALRHRASLYATVREPTLLVFAAAAVGLSVLVHGRLFLHYDNFSHWALVVAVMLEGDALPSAADTLIDFPSYPLGGASLAYLGSRLVGRDEWVAMLFHSLWTASCALPLMSATGRRRLAGAVAFLAGAGALLTYITMPNSLLVDALVAGLAGVLLCLLVFHRTELLRSPWPLAVVGAALVSTKASGLLFVVLGTAAALPLLRAAARAAGGGRRTLVPWLVALASPFILWLVWRLHVSATFPAGEQSKHSASLDWFSAVLSEKTPEDLRVIAAEFVSRAVSSPTSWLLLVALLLAALTPVGRGQRPDTGLRRRALVLTLTTWAVWQVSLLAMYWVSMPLREALNLAAYGRYQGTVHLVVLLVLLHLVAHCHLVQKRWTPTNGLVVLLVGATVVTMVKPLSLEGDRREVQRRQVDGALAGLAVGENEEVCLVLEEPDSGYRTWMARYVLLHDRVRSYAIADEDGSMPAAFEDCDVYVPLDDRDHTRRLLRDAGVPADRVAEGGA